METSNGIMQFANQQPGTTNGEVYTTSLPWGPFPTSFTPTGYGSAWTDTLYAGYCPVSPYTHTPTPTVTQTPSPTPTVCVLDLSASGASTILGPGTYNFCWVTIGSGIGASTPSICYVTGPATTNVNGNFVINNRGFFEMQKT